jgi:hypothetical protein
MAFDRQKVAQTARAVIFLAMGVVLCIFEPHAIRENPNTGFLNFTRYLIAVLLVFGGAKRLYRIYFSKNSDHSDT